ncbi:MULTISPECIES: ABC transporter permease [Pseudomonas]|uniref:ABC transporter permease n=1 Tax=Pseudomonas TaxID=286 RepID=UPI000A1F18FB|nr:MULTISPECIES: ABC transporter permease [Pseudomonas]MCX4216460.1 ABC transporter permease [Pseudomonas sp. MCal1]UDI90448.1 ABC transporter permease [Pseudomonas sp. IAC-BECa141]UIN54041.1 ABC transporter permease [Pseudomonas kribbensis]
MSLPSYTGPLGRTWFYGVRGFGLLVLLFLILPVLVVIPLSFNVEPYFSFTSGMLKLDPAAFSSRWYHELLEDPMWLLSFKNSLIIAASSTVIATLLGTLAALGLSRSNLPCKALLMGTLISPMIVPVIISSAGMYFFYSTLGLAHNHLGIILAHAVLGTPFVIITVTATLVSFDHSLTRAASSLGASSSYTFLRITFPLIRPGIISGGLFAMVTSFDEAVVVQFLGGIEQRTIPRQMWSGMREQISPTILAAATLLILGSVMLLVAIEIMRRRALRLRGIKE